MARISSYAQDTSLSTTDKVLGTDSATSATKNFTIESVITLINELGSIHMPDGAPYKFKDYVSDPSYTVQGCLSLNSGTALTTAFSAITQVILSKKDKTV